LLREGVEFALVSIGGMLIGLFCLWVSHYLLGFDNLLADNISGNDSSYTKNKLRGIEKINEIRALDVAFFAASVDAPEINAEFAKSLELDYISRSEHRLCALEVLYERKSWADVVREAQEIVELALKALSRGLRFLSPAFFNREHDEQFVLRVVRLREPGELGQARDGERAFQERIGRVHVQVHEIERGHGVIPWFVHRVGTRGRRVHRQGHGTVRYAGFQQGQTLVRHARPCAGHPRLKTRPEPKDVDGRDEPGHDNFELQIAQHLRPDGDHAHEQRQRRQRGGFLDDGFDHGSLP